MEAFNPIETSKKVLSECHILTQKNTKVRQIRPGEGHLIGNGDKSISEIYEKFYPRPVHKKLPSIFPNKTLTDSN